jgi:hypothetical protein
MKRLTLEQLIERSNKIHGDKYDYSLVEYKNNRTKVKIICPIHGVFEQDFDHHFKGHGCLKCSNNNPFTIQQFIERAKQVHGDKYDYSLVEYINHHIKVKIICKKHGIFEQVPLAHLNNEGCPKCRRSKGEEKVEKFLLENNINYIPQYKFNDCRHKRSLPFDFYLPDYNTCIEYQGEQHYHEYKKMGGIEKLKQIQYNDNIKKTYCKNNNIKLLEICYKEDVKERLEWLYQV